MDKTGPAFAKQNRVEAILDEYIGLRSGIRHSDAQAYVQ